MKKQQIVLAFTGLLLLGSLLFFGKTAIRKETTSTPGTKRSSVPRFNFEEYLQNEKEKLTLNQQNTLSNLENSVNRGDVKDQQIKAYNQLATFWNDSAHEHNLQNFYVAGAAKLVNSEKNLTFAAQQFLNDLRLESDMLKRSWEAEQAIELFEKAIERNPNNDSLKIGLASCYVFGKGMAGDAQETMKGIQQLLQVIKRDSANMQAQLVLGIGGVVSTQYDKAIIRLQTVVKNQPSNLEAISWLADAYAGKGDKQNALKWYEVSKRLVNNPAYTKEVNERIKMLQ